MADMTKMKIGIILGGLSSEKDISLESGRNIFSKINRKKYDPLPIFMDDNASLWEIPLKLLMRNSTKDIGEDLREEAKPLRYEDLKARIDLAFLALHGKYGEDGCLQGLLELLGLPYTGSGVLASALGMDKHFCRQFLAASGIDVPKTIAVTKPDWTSDVQATTADRIESEIGFPCVIKPAREGCSTAVTKAVSREDVNPALTNAFLWDNTALIEEFLTGMEVTCGILEGDRPFPLIPSETIPTDRNSILSLEDKFLYGKGENKTPARLPETSLKKIQETALATFTALNLRCYARIDMFVLPDGRIVVLEANTLPGMTPSTVLFHQAAAMDMTQAGLIDLIITAALRAHSTKKGPL
ncbi:MAG: D-alanine--D-alanine ligase [Deltaproteobacteria bacterium]|nr:D-alanine--D-alanine ligase [Deltaproteobacteria bacterium]